MVKEGNTPTPLLRKAYERAARYDSFVAHDLATYKAAHGIDDSIIAEVLGCDLRTLYKLALCIRPGSTQDASLHDYAVRVGEGLGIDVGRLETLLARLLAEGERRTPTNE